MICCVIPEKFFLVQVFVSFILDNQLLLCWRRTRPAVCTKASFSLLAGEPNVEKVRILEQRAILRGDRADLTIFTVVSFSLFATELQCGLCDGRASFIPFGLRLQEGALSGPLNFHASGNIEFDKELKFRAPSWRGLKHRRQLCS